MLKKHVFLVGFMGVGKTTNGKKLARALNRPFVDLDELFVEQVGLSITAYFKEHSEEAFRFKEREILQNLAISEPAVIATGGGAPCFFDNMEWMNSHGITIYLQMPTGALAKRLADSKKNKRPLIQHLNEEELVGFIEERMQHRHPFYMQAHHHVNVLDLNIDALIKNLEL
ncbi:shikimate kinase [Olivibacter sp. XZL3]|uniref:shikimate kinase n=1 Tax=Olivibacter sp. XZL3 TaxID=1735116 RepID=UPI0010664AE1|nr:shikimate kinase [Olivibacter sp. XZL3]